MVKMAKLMYCVFYQNKKKKKGKNPFLPFLGLTWSFTTPSILSPVHSQVPVSEANKDHYYFHSLSLQQFPY